MRWLVDLSGLGRGCDEMSLRQCGGGNEAMVSRRERGYGKQEGDIVAYTSTRRCLLRLGRKSYMWQFAIFDELCVGRVLSCRVVSVFCRGRSMYSECVERAEACLPKSLCRRIDAHDGGTKSVEPVRPRRCVLEKAHPKRPDQTILRPDLLHVSCFDASCTPTMGVNLTWLSKTNAVATAEPMGIPLAEPLRLGHHDRS
jgi:hypothetical protein